MRWRATSKPVHAGPLCPKRLGGLHIYAGFPACLLCASKLFVRVGSREASSRMRIKRSGLLRWVLARGSLVLLAKRRKRKVALKKGREGGKDSPYHQIFLPLLWWKFPNKVKILSAPLEGGQQKIIPLPPCPHPLLLSSFLSLLLLFSFHTFLCNPSCPSFIPK